MNEYLYVGTSADDHRNLLREIDAGELDERYLIKHSPDYGGRTTAHPVNALQSFISRLFRLRDHLVQSQHTDAPIQVVSQSGSQR
jgi:hypothetical protein